MIFTHFWPILDMFWSTFDVKTMGIYPWIDVKSMPKVNQILYFHQDFWINNQHIWRNILEIKINNPIILHIDVDNVDVHHLNSNIHLTNNPHVDSNMDFNNHFWHKLNLMPLGNLDFRAIILILD